MATTVTSTIGSGRDYSTIQAWEDATPADLVAADQIWQGQIYKEGGGTNGEWVLTSALTFAGTTGDATRYSELIPASGQGLTAGNALRYNPANGVAIATATAYEHVVLINASQWVRLIGLQFNNRQSGANRYCIAGLLGSNIYSDRCIFKQDATGRAVSYATANDGGNVFRRITNSVIHVTSSAIAFYNDSPSPTQIRNVTAYGNSGSSAFHAAYSQNSIVLNCAAFGFSAFVNNGSNFDSASSGNNATDLATAFGSTGTNRTSLTASNQFENLTGGSEDFRAKSGGALIANASVDSTYASSDIFGSARSGSAPTIGANEAASASDSAGGQRILRPHMGVGSQQAYFYGG